MLFSVRRVLYLYDMAMIYIPHKYWRFCTEQPNARGEPRLEAGAERRLEGVGSSARFGTRSLHPLGLSLMECGRDTGSCSPVMVMVVLATGQEPP